MRRPRARLAFGLAAVGALAAAGTVVALQRGGAPSMKVVTRSVPGADHTQLSAYVVTPAGRAAFPLLVMPTAWGEPRDYYLVVAKGLAEQGYGVVTYAQRGFSGSGGEIDFAAAPTQTDVSAVIDWALAHLHARADQIGAVGMSYGGGASLLAAERDPRIRAVVAMSAWADLGAALFPNDTPSEKALGALYQVANQTGDLGVQLTEFFGEYASGDVTGATTTFLAMSPARSASAHVAALNKNHTAVMLANAYQDSLLPPGQLVTFFNRLTGPKRLQLAVGDHTGPEASALSGARNTVWSDAAAWLDHYLRGRANGVDRQRPVRLQDVTTGALHSYPNWGAVGHDLTRYLGTAGVGAATMAEQPQPGWSILLAAGLDSTADAAPMQLNPSKKYQLTEGVRMGRIDTSRAAVWNTSPLPEKALVQGSPDLHLTVAASTAQASVFAYLYDVSASGVGALITTAPYTLAPGAPNTPRAVDIRLEPISWTVPAGHHLSLVVDTVDPRYHSLSTPGSTVQLGSPAGDPARVSIPIG